DVQLYQTPGSGETIMGSNVTGGGSTGAVKPTVAITSTGGTVTPIAQTVAGTVDLADAGSTANVTLAHLGANVVTATDTNAAGTGTSNSVTYTVARPLAPTISIANPNLSVTEGGGTVALGIKATANTLQSSTIVTIQGLPSYETITDKLDHLTFQGNLI